MENRSLITKKEGMNCCLLMGGSRVENAAGCEGLRLLFGKMAGCSCGEL